MHMLALVFLRMQVGTKSKGAERMRPSNGGKEVAPALRSPTPPPFWTWFIENPRRQGRMTRRRDGRNIPQEVVSFLAED
jgi:hypothetical protein